MNKTLQKNPKNCDKPCADGAASCNQSAAKPGPGDPVNSDQRPPMQGAATPAQA